MPAINPIPREEVPVAQTWNAEAVFPNAAAWQAEYEAVKGDLNQLEPYQGNLSESPSTLAQFMELLSQLRRRVMKLYFYGLMNNAVNGLNEDAKAMIGQSQSLFSIMGRLASFMRPELLGMGEDLLGQWLRDNEPLQVYEMFMSDLFRQQKHVLSAEVETILGQLNDPFSTATDIHGELTDSDMVFPDAHDSAGQPFAVTQGTIDVAKAHADRDLRRNAWNIYADTYLGFKNTLTTTYITSVKQNIFTARVRGYESALHMKLFPFNLPVEVFHNLINTFKQNIPTWQRYWDVKRRILGYETIHPYDIWAPMTRKEPEVSYEQAVHWICDGMRPLGDDYSEIVRKGCLEERWVDWSINKAKGQGAFSFGTYDTAPYIMMSYDYSLGGMSTLAHELGHSMHSYYSRANQPEIYASYSMFAAETASNFNQAMVRAHLFETNSDRDFQLALIQEAMDNFHRYFFIMPTLARFELEVHDRVNAGKPVTADILNGIMSDFYAEGYGSSMTDDRQRTGITWSQFGHLYNCFYTFQYALGISAAHALSDKIRKGDGNAVQNYRKFLAAGSSLYGLDALKMAGVDMNTPEPVEKAFELLNGLIDRLESLI